MANVLVVHDDSMISRVAYLLEKRKENIRRCKAILRGDPGLPDEYYHSNREGVEKMLEAERWALSDLLEDIENGMFIRELQAIFTQYVQEEI